MYNLKSELNLWKNYNVVKDNYCNDYSCRNYYTVNVFNKKI